MDALLKETGLQRDFFIQNPSTGPLQNQVIETIYFGGGTPSLLNAKEAGLLLNQIDRYFTVSEDCEITLEANPDDITFIKAGEWLRAGINRLSIGIQSFFDEDLAWMNRAHDARQAMQCIEDIRQAGFENFSADLIFGMPTLADDRWENNIARMLTLGVPHLSCYALTVEPRTALDHFIREKKYLPVSEEQTARQFEMLMERLAAAGYAHYEISNFALPGRRSKHNSNYWQGTPYLGIGPSAHSYSGKTRRWNAANNALYIKSIHENKIPAEEETLSPVMQWNEYLMTSLRTMEGCDLDAIEEKWGKAETEKLKAESEKFRTAGQMILQDQRLILTNKGKLFADGIAAELFR
jgi:oxygen-independent coproporphyrinogen-3 oxidase